MRIEILFQSVHVYQYQNRLYNSPSIVIFFFSFFRVVFIINVFVQCVAVNGVQCPESSVAVDARCVLRFYVYYVLDTPPCLPNKTFCFKNKKQKIQKNTKPNKKHFVFMFIMSLTPPLPARLEADQCTFCLSSFFVCLFLCFLLYPYGVFIML